MLQHQALLVQCYVPAPLHATYMEWGSDERSERHKEMSSANYTEKDLKIKLVDGIDISKEANLGEKHVKAGFAQLFVSRLWKWKKKRDDEFKLNLNRFWMIHWCSCPDLCNLNELGPKKMNSAKEMANDLKIRSGWWNGSLHWLIDWLERVK